MQLDVTGAVRLLPRAIVTAVLRVAPEAVTTVFRHADATDVRLQLRYRRGAVGLTVTDRGHGFVSERESGAYAGHFGLVGMRERASELGGRLIIEAESGRGTVVRLRVAISSRRAVVRAAQSDIGRSPTA